MAGSTKFPGALDDGSTLYQPGGGDLVASVDHAALHDNASVATIATQTKVGTGSSTPTNATVLRGTGTGTSQWAQANLTTDVTGTLPVANGGTGATGATGTGNVVLANTPSLTNPAFSSITNTGTLTLPSSTDTLVGRATTDTLTNKSMDGGSNTFTGITTASLDLSSLRPVQSYVATAESTTSTSYANLTTTQSLTVTVPASGILRVDMNLRCYGNQTSNMVLSASFALSGGNTLAASDTNGVSQKLFNSTSVGLDETLSGSVILTGLTAGSTTVTMKFLVTTGTGTFYNRRIIATPVA